MNNITDSFSRSLGPIFFSSEPLIIEGHSYTAQEVWSLLSTQLTEERKQKIWEIAGNRSQLLIPVLENIYDRGNIHAVMRSAEAFGFYRLHIIESPQARYKTANRVSQGTEKWMQIEIFRQVQHSFAQLKKAGYQILVTHLDPTSQSLSEVDWSRPTAVVFGNEKEGVSDSTRKLADGYFKLPMFGFVQSFNISVAAAITFSFAHEYNKKTVDHKSHPLLKVTPQQQLLLAANYALRSVDHSHVLLKELKARS